MADSLSAVGSAVGIVSLGLHLSERLITYIDGVKTAREKAEHITADLEQLTDILEQLETIVGKAEASPISTATRTGVIACVTAMGQIKKHLDRFGTSKDRGI